MASRIVVLACRARSGAHLFSRGRLSSMGAVLAPCEKASRGPPPPQPQAAAWLSRTAVLAAAASLAVGLAVCDGAHTIPADADCGAATRKRATTFREKQISDYEDRLRLYSSPNKVFRYFATVAVDGTPYMRPADFVRALTPGEMQPEGLGLDVFTALSADKARCTGRAQRLLEYDAEGNVTNSDVLISHSEFIFLLSVLSTPKHQFDLAFCMFDLDGNGTVDLDEFNRVQIAVQSKSAKYFGGEAMSKITLERSLLLNRFFGAKGDLKLDLKRFDSFVDELQHDVLHLDFLIHNRKSADRACISPDGLARMLLKYAHIRREERGKFYERVTRNFGADHPGITFTEALKFFDFLTCIDDVEKALSLYAAAGISITEKDFVRAAKIAANVTLSPALVHFIFVLFDNDGDGELNHSEFIVLMKDARTRGLNRDRSLGAGRGFKALVSCVKTQIQDAKLRAEE